MTLPPEPLEPLTVDPLPARTAELFDADHSVVFDRLIEDDPIGLLQRCALELRERALLIEPDRLFARAARMVAHRFAGRYGVPDADSIASILRSAVLQLLQIDKRLAAEPDSAPPEEAHYEFLVREFYVPPIDGPRAANAFNGLAPETRRATLRFLMDAVSAEDCIREGLAEDQEHLVRMAREGLLALVHAVRNRFEEGDPHREGNDVGSVHP